MCAIKISTVTKWTRLLVSKSICMEGKEDIKQDIRQMRKREAGDPLTVKRMDNDLSLRQERLGQPCGGHSRKAFKHV